MNNIVNFELSKLLVECGFDEKCKNYWVENLEHSLECRDGVYKFPAIPLRVLDFIPKENYHKIHCVAPTIPQAVMWLIDKHKLWIYVKQGYKWEWVIETVSTTPEIKYTDSFENPTEAYEAAITYALTNLII